MMQDEHYRAFENLKTDSKSRQCQKTLEISTAKQFFFKRHLHIVTSFNQYIVENQSNVPEIQVVKNSL